MTCLGEAGRHAGGAHNDFYAVRAVCYGTVVLPIYVKRGAGALPWLQPARALPWRGSRDPADRQWPATDVLHTHHTLQHTPHPTPHTHPHPPHHALSPTSLRSAFGLCLALHALLPPCSASHLATPLLPYHHTCGNFYLAHLPRAHAPRHFLLRAACPLYATQRSRGFVGTHGILILAGLRSDMPTRATPPATPQATW